MSKLSSFRRRLLCGAGILVFVPVLSAQLAITEVMSSASTNLGAVRVPAGPDFWELTNFGTNTLDLSDFLFGDEVGAAGADAELLNGLQIAPDESIIFFELDSSAWTNAAQIRAWWGEENLPANLQIYGYNGPGFSSVRDAVQLWHDTGGGTTLVQRVELYQANRGHTLTYDPVTGVLDTFSELGATNVFKAMEADDVGSPGFTSGPAPLTVTQQPQSVTVDGGFSANFSVQARGLPQARFQWRFNGVNIAGAVSNRLEISALEPIHAGAYSVELNNGVTNLLSVPAILQVNPVPRPPTIVIPPADLTVTPDQTAVFRVIAVGYPIPTYQWQFNGVDIPGATTGTLLVPNVDFAHGGTYSVRLHNANGSTNAGAVLVVRSKPNLKITEMMGSTSTNTTISGRADWWELTNFDTNAVNLRGYRFDDSPGALEGAIVITNDVVIQPGESVLFIEGMTADLFTRWWGEENLPENVQFVRYAGNGFNASNDNMTLWNATALESSDFIAYADYLNLNPDFTPVRGISLNFWCDGWIEFGEQSATNICGGIRAARSGDIGSPGYVTNHPPRPRALQILYDAQGVHLVWKTQPGVHYELLCKDILEVPSWRSLGQHLATSDTLFLTDATATNMTRFYRLRVAPGLE